MKHNNGSYAAISSNCFIEIKNKNLIITREDGKKSEKELPFKEFEVCGLGANGNLAIKAKDGIYIINIEGAGSVRFVKEFAAKALASKHSAVGAVELNNTGSLICVEKINYNHSFLDKLLNKMRAVKAPPQAANYQFVLYNLRDKTARNAFTFSFSGKGKSAMKWAISSNFKYLVLIEKEVRSGKGFLYIINLAINKVLAKIDISDVKVENISVNNLGACLCDTNGSGKGYLILTSNGKISRFHKESSSHLMHFGNRIMAFKKIGSHRLIIKGLDEKVIYEANLEPLEKLNGNYKLFFNDDDDIDLVMPQNGNVKIVKCHLNNFQYDLKKWDDLAKKYGKLKIFTENKTVDPAVCAAGVMTDSAVTRYEELSVSLYESLKEKMRN